MIRQELKRMAQRKFLSRSQLELLLQLPDDRLSVVCSTLMFDIFQLSEKDIKSLISAKDEKTFIKVLKRIKRELADSNITGIEKALLYETAKFFGQVEFRKKDRAFVRDALNFLLNRIMVPCLKMIEIYYRDGILDTTNLAPLREFFRNLL
jgi:hypothetical protein